MFPRVCQPPPLYDMPTNQRLERRNRTPSRAGIFHSFHFCGEYLVSENLGRRTMPKLTKTVVDAAIPRAKQFTLWCSDLPGFGVYILPTGNRTYFVDYGTAPASAVG